MSTAFLMDASGLTSISMNQDQAHYIVRAFRPEDIVFCFDYRPLMVEFQGNPTFVDIMRLAREMSGVCTGLNRALIEANRIIPGCRRIVLGSGKWEDFHSSCEYEEIFFEYSGRRK